MQMLTINEGVTSAWQKIAFHFLSCWKPVFRRGGLIKIEKIDVTENNAEKL